MMKVIALVAFACLACAETQKPDDFFESLMNAPKDSFANMMNGHELAFDEEEEDSSFLEETATEKPKAKCAIKCRTECGQGQGQAEAANNATTPDDEEGEAQNATDVEALRAKAKAAPKSGKTVVSRKCLNHCGGLCCQLCGKFKVLKVCNGCVRDCLKRCKLSGDQQPAAKTPGLTNLIQEDEDSE